MSSSNTMLRSSLRLFRSVVPCATSKPLIISQTKSLASLSKLNPLACVVPNHGLIRSMATQGDQEVSKFLLEEIQTEKKNARALPKLDGWNISCDGAEVTLTKDVAGGEKVMITLNVNHTVDSAEPDDGTEEAPEMLSTPNFEVDLIKKNGNTLSFSCSYISPEEQHPEGGAQEEGLDDVFAIDEVTMFEGDNHKDSCYAVAGDILDGYLYDLMMTMLEERGVDNEFAERLSEWCSSYEHSQYINLLEQVEKWTKL